VGLCTFLLLLFGVARPAEAAADAPPCGGGRLVRRTITVGGLRRSYVVRTVSPEAPVLLAFHGYSSSASRLVASSGLATAGPAAGFTTVFPEGTGTPTRWAIADRLPGPDDVAFVAALLTDLRRMRCGDPTRVAAAGFSNGAAFTAHLACRWPHRFTGIALVGGAGFAPPCASVRVPSDVPVVLVHGALDRTVPLRGGPVLGGALQAEPFATAVARWRRAPDRTVVVATVPGLGHTWPPLATQEIVTTFAP
jgi:poly(3-hydroxybutyrate) depolymerase